jgi:hypothetical protein
MIDNDVTDVNDDDIENKDMTYKGIKIVTINF